MNLAPLIIRCLVYLSLVLLMPSALAEAENNVSSKEDISEKKHHLKTLREQIDTLKKEIAETQGKRVDAADQLKSLEQEISATERGLREISAQRNKFQDNLKEISKESKNLEKRLATQQLQLEKLMYHQYLQGHPDAFYILLNGDNPSALSRDLYYLSLISKARQELLHEISATLSQKQSISTRTEARLKSISEISATYESQRQKLMGQREERKRLLTKISTKLNEQRQEIGSLQRNEKQLTQLVDRLSKILAERAQAERQQKRTEAPTGKKGSTPQEIENDRSPEASLAGNFAELKGKLRLPVRGTVTNRFGSTRQGETTWKGLFIRASIGTEIKAIAKGRIVFSDWMRGFGNLIIIDHGKQYLSIYGNNEAVFKQLGDTLEAGEVIASVGNSGGNPESGLYFELRHRGQALDPLEWTSLK